jgi:hypothetical protein
LVYSFIILENSCGAGRCGEDSFFFKPQRMLGI